MATVNVKKVIQELVVPELQEIKSDIATIKVEIKRLDEKIERVDEKIDDVKDDVRNLRSEFHMAIDMHERIAALEAKIGMH